MQITRAFKSGNSQAVRIPADLAYANISGDVIIISPARPSMNEMVARLRALPALPESEPFERTEVPERNWD